MDPLPRLTALALPRPGRWDERRALEDDAQRNLAAIRHDSKAEREALLLTCGVPNTKRGFDVGETAYRIDKVNKDFYGADTQHAKG